MSNTATLLRPCVHFPSLTCITNPPLIRAPPAANKSHYLRPSLRRNMDRRKSLGFPKSVKFNTPLEQVLFFDPVQSEDEYDSEYDSEEEDKLEDDFLALFTKKTQFDIPSPLSSPSARLLSKRL